MRTAAALLVIDVQSKSMEPEPFATCDGNDLLAKCCALIDAARTADIPVIYVKHHGDVRSLRSDEGRNLPKVAP